MTKYLVYAIVMCIIILHSMPVKAQDRGFGLGFVLGEPTGVSAKLWTSKINALDFGLGVAVGGDRISYNGHYNGEGRIHFHMDYLWHSFNAIRATAKFPLYYGIGGRYNSGGGYDGSLGLRGVFGIAWFPNATPIDVFLEVVPVFQLTPSTGFGVDAGFGVRYFFE